MKSITSRLAPIFLIVIIIFTLLNSKAFGASTLISYFMFCCLSGIFAIAIFFKGLFKRTGVDAPSLPVLIFLLLTVYIQLHGIARGEIGLTHYYWLAGACLLFSIHYWIGGYMPANKDQGTTAAYDTRISFLFTGITFIAFAESLVVLLQVAAIIPVPNSNFLCTGTWVNPNVTAMFLALSLYAILKSLRDYRGMKKLGGQVILFVTVIAIIALLCRTAYIVAGVLICTEYWSSIKKQFKKYFQLNLKGLLLVLLLFVVGQILISTFAFKGASTSNRILIWGRSIELMSHEKWQGHGFGKFEKEYNLFTAENNYEVNDHIIMPYNDLLELGVEGGLPAMILWFIFMTILLRQAWRTRKQDPLLLSLVLGFTIIQLTNFAFQAIPVMTLFLIYIGITPFSSIRIPHRSWQLARRFSYSFIGITGALILLINEVPLCRAFYNNWRINTVPDSQKFYRYDQLARQLDGFAIYHESYGDALLAQKREKLALQQYLKGLRVSSSPDLFGKAALCYQLLGQYDSSEHYYLVIQNMQPHKFLPRYALLKLYEQANQPARQLAKATEILAMPVRIRNKKVLNIKIYAKRIADSLNTSGPTSLKTISNNY